MFIVSVMNLVLQSSILKFFSQPPNFGVSVRGPGQREQAGGEYLFCGMYNTNNSKCFWHLEYLKIHFVHFFMNVFPHFNICFTTSQGSG